MPINEFKLERYYAKYEFSAKYMFSSSDCESLKMSELLDMAKPVEVKLWEELSLGYTESQGLPILREAVANTYESVHPEQVVMAAPEEAIFIAMQSLVSAGDEVVVVWPAYQSLYEVARSMGCKVIPWSMQLGPSGWQLDFFALEGLITPRTRLVVINFPNNPTGYLPTQSELDVIVRTARSHNLFVFSDEMYRMLERDQSQRLPAICDIYEKGVSLSGLSKAYALPGLRMGWLATRYDPLPGQFLAMKDYTTICCSAPSEVLALIALGNLETITRRNREIIQGNLDKASRFFKNRELLFHWVEPKAGSVAFPQWLGDQSVEQFCLDVVDRQGVMIVPGNMFEFSGSHFRVGLGRRNFNEALEKLGDYLDNK